MKHAKTTNAVGSRSAPGRTTAPGRRTATCIRCVESLWEGLHARRQAKARCDSQEAKHVSGRSRPDRSSTAGAVGEVPCPKEEIDSGALSSVAGKETVLHSFALVGGDGSAPQGALIRDSAGNLYGTTQLGGTFGYGTVFKLTP
jgi:uncharacterized repeat protein (TIGR03803 family)